MLYQSGIPIAMTCGSSDGGKNIANSKLDVTPHMDQVLTGISAEHFDKLLKSEDPGGGLMRRNLWYRPTRRPQLNLQTLCRLRQRFQVCRIDIAWLTFSIGRRGAATSPRRLGRPLAPILAGRMFRVS